MGTLGSPSRRHVVWLLLATHLTFAALIITVGSRQLYGSDGIRRYHEIAHAPGIPYRDIEVEYAPVDLGLILIVSHGDLITTYRVVVGLAAIADVVLYLMIEHTWGQGSALAFLACMIPLLPIAFMGLDLVWVACVTASFALIRSDRHKVGGMLLGITVLARVWPIVLMPVVWAMARRRAVIVTATVVAVGLALWWLAAAPGIRQVATYRGAHGWEFESSVGAILWTVGRGIPHLESGAPRFGNVLPWQRILLAGVLLAGLWAISWRTRTWPDEDAGVPALASVSLLLAASPIFGLGYILWLLPWMSVAWSERPSRTYSIVATVAVTLTGLLSVIYLTTSAPELSKVLLLVRNGAVAFIPLWFIVRKATTGHSSDGESGEISEFAR